jgi:hypothetical protein
MTTNQLTLNLASSELAARLYYYDQRIALYAALPNDIARAELFLSEVRTKHHDDSHPEVAYAQRRLEDVCSKTRRLP